jgi:hypothetical protein
MPCWAVEPTPCAQGFYRREVGILDALSRAYRERGDVLAAVLRAGEAK